MTNEELIDGILNRDRQSLTCLVEKYQENIMKTAYYFTANMEEAEEIAQDVFLEILRSAGSFRGHAGLSTWIYRITVNKSLNQIRKNKRRELFQRIETLFTGSGTPSSGIAMINPSVEQSEARRILNKAINGLPESQRTAFVLHKFEDFSHKEIASVLQVTVAAVESLIHRARLNLRKKLGPYFPEYVKQN